MIKNIWDKNIPFPKYETLEYPNNIFINTITRKDDKYSFLHDTAIADFRDNELFAAWYNSAEGEMQGTTVIRGSYSYDNGITWQNPITISPISPDIRYVPVSVGIVNNKKTAFVTKMIGPDRPIDWCVFEYIDNNWTQTCSTGLFFIANTMPIKLINGNYIIGGRSAAIYGGEPYLPGVVIFNPKENKDSFRFIPFRGAWSKDKTKRLKYPETALIANQNNIEAFVRNDNGNAIYFKSDDYGHNFNQAYNINLPIGASKIYGGKLSNGKKYLIYNSTVKGYRKQLVIAITEKNKDSFSKIYKIIDETNTQKLNSEFSYPCAIEKDGYLCITCTSEKKLGVFIRIPICSLN